MTKQIYFFTVWLHTRQLGEPTPPEAAGGGGGAYSVKILTTVMQSAQTPSSGWLLLAPSDRMTCMFQRERERELRREGGKSLLAYVKGVDPHLKHACSISASAAAFMAVID